MLCPNCGGKLQRISGEFTDNGNIQDSWVCQHCLNVYGEDNSLIGFIAVLHPPEEKHEEENTNG